MRGTAMWTRSRLLNYVGKRVRVKIKPNEHVCGRLKEVGWSWPPFGWWTRTRLLYFETMSVRFDDVNGDIYLFQAASSSSSASMVS